MTYRKIYRFIQAGMLALAGSMLAASGVLAYWTVQGKTINILTSSAYRAQIEEEYEIPPHVSPGVTVDKTVDVVNCGTVDMFVRVKLEKKFGTRDDNGILQEDSGLDPELIEITCNQNFWKYLDGYWYYTEVLPAGEKTKEPLFEQYTVSETADNAYKGKDAEIIVTMESVQAEGNAVSLWGMKKEDLGISYIADTKDTVTQVTYVGAEEGFSFSQTDTDLFANFKNLLPGCARTQRIAVKNRSGEAVELFLRAEAADQEQMSDQQRRLVYLMLSKYAKITVKQGETVLYQGPVDGNLNKTGQSMGQDISLGTFAAGEEQELVVTLSMSSEMEHDMQLLSGRVQWIFTAKGQEQETALVTGVIPKTGDETNLLFMGLILAGSMVLFAAALYWKRSDGR